MVIGRYGGSMRKTSIFVSLFIAALMMTGGNICRAAEATKASQASLWTFDKEHAGKLPAGAAVFAGKVGPCEQNSTHQVHPMHYVRPELPIIQRCL